MNIIKIKKHQKTSKNIKKTSKNIKKTSKKTTSRYLDRWSLPMAMGCERLCLDVFSPRCSRSGSRM